MWMNGVLDPRNEDLTAVRDIVDTGLPPEGIESFGIDVGGPLPIQCEDSHAVEVEEIPCPFENLDLNEFLRMFNPLQRCPDYGVSIYLAARQYLMS